MSRSMLLRSSALAILLAGAVSVHARLTAEQRQSLPPPAARPVDFAKDIKPIFEASCIQCHARGKAKGGVRLDTRDTLLQGARSGLLAVPGRSAESLLVKVVSGLDPDNVMPAKGNRLTPEQVGLLRAWIDQQLPWPGEITFAKPPPQNLHPRKPALPPATAAAGPHSIDRLLAPYFVQHRLTPARVVDDRAFARRAFLDVVGLPPSPAELDSFLADKRRDKRERLVDRLLADNRRYAVHWLSFWNDLLRNDYKGTGFIDDGRKQISEWLYRALAENWRYDRFVRALVNPGSDGSEGFAMGIVWRGVVNASQTPQMQASQNIGQVFLGVNLKCASCHDSFINDWTLADAYGLASVYTDEPLEMFRCDKPTGMKAVARFPYPELGDIAPGLSQAQKRERLAELLTAPQNGRLARTIVNRFWGRLFGRALVEPVDDMEQPAWSADVLDWLAEDLVASGYDLKHTLRVMLTSRAYQFPAVVAEEAPRADYVFAGPAVRRLSAEQFRDALGAVAGAWHEKPAAELDFTSGRPASEAEANLTPAPVKWIWSEPGAAQKAPAETVYFWKRVLLQAVPDEAFVTVTCDNSFTLHVNGGKVLDGSDFKKLKFADIRKHLRAGENLFAVEAANFTPENKPASTDKAPDPKDANPAGLLLYARLRAGARAFDFGTDASWSFSRKKADGWEKPEHSPAEAQPAVELGDVSLGPWEVGHKLAAGMSVALLHGEVRSSLVAADPLMAALGRPNREQVSTTRLTTATTLQGLELTNGDTLTKLLALGAEKLVATAPKSGAELVNQLYAKALGRIPTRAEAQLAVDLLGQPVAKEHVEDLLWSLAMLPEFQLIY